MSCEQFEQQIALLAGGDLPAGEAHEVELHLDSCPACRELAEELRADLGEMRQLAARQADEEMLRELRRSVVETLAAGRGRRLKLWRYAAAACLLLAFAGSMIWHNARDAHKPAVAVKPSMQAPPNPALPAEHTGRQAVTAAADPRQAPDRQARRRQVRTDAREAEMPPRQPDPELDLALERVAEMILADKRKEPEVATPPAENKRDVLVKMATGDPDVIVLWVLDANGDTE